MKSGINMLWWELLTAQKDGLTSTGYLKEIMKREQGKILAHTPLPISSTLAQLTEHQLPALEHTEEHGKPAAIAHCTVCCDLSLHSLGDRVCLQGL